MNTEVDEIRDVEEIIDEFVKAWAKYKSTPEDPNPDLKTDAKSDAWADAICLLDEAMTQYLIEEYDTDIPEEMSVTDFVFKELWDRNPYTNSETEDKAL